MKYYGIKNKIIKEEALYRYAKFHAKIHSLLPSRKREYWKNHYHSFRNDFEFRRNNNSIPKDGYLCLNSFIVADLIRREDLDKLKIGVKRLLLKYRSNRFIYMNQDGLDDICSKIEHLDSTLSQWYYNVECGFFEFNKHPLEASIDYFSLTISNLNSAFLSVQFEIHMAKQKSKQLNDIICSNYQDKRGYASPSLTSSTKESGALKTYLVIHYNEDALKADKIHEFLSMIEWDFMETLKTLFPFVLHKGGIMPPRIETYYTNIDYREMHREFWASIGVYKHQGQFIDDRHKMFFVCTLSGRYENNEEYRSRLLYIIKDDGIEPGRFLSVKDYANMHLRDYSADYFRILFLRILIAKAGKSTVLFKQKLDLIKLKRNRLQALLKLKYKYSVAIDDYYRYIRSNGFEGIEDRLANVYGENDVFLENVKRPFLFSYKGFCDNTINWSNKIEKEIDVLMKEFEDKKQILQNLSDFRYAEKSMSVNFIMLGISMATLYFLLFPNRAGIVAGFIKSCIGILWGIIKNSLPS